MQNPRTRTNTENSDESKTGSLTPKRYICEECNKIGLKKSYTTSRNLTTHITNKHTDKIKKYSCKTCNPNVAPYSQLLHKFIIKDLHEDIPDVETFNKHVVQYPQCKF